MDEMLSILKDSEMLKNAIETRARLATGVKTLVLSNNG